MAGRAKGDEVRDSARSTVTDRDEVMEVKSENPAAGGDSAAISCFGEHIECYLLRDCLSLGLGRPTLHSHRKLRKGTERLSSAAGAAGGDDDHCETEMAAPVGRNSLFRGAR